MSFEAMTGDNGILSVVLSGTTETEIVGLTEVDVDTSRDKYPSTVMGNTSKSAKVGLPNFAGTISGLVDANSSNVFLLNDGVAKTFTLKLDRSAPSTASHQWRGSAFFDVKTKAPVEGIVSCEVTITAQNPGVDYAFSDAA